MMEIEVIVDEDLSEAPPVNIEQLRLHACNILGSHGIDAGEVNIVFIDDAYMAELNSVYKGRKGTTDVLSFNLTDEYSKGLLGEVYISLERAKKQAGEYEIPFAEEIVRLATHGLLHLAGFTHDDDIQCEDMARRTDELVKGFFSARGEP